MSIRVKSEIGKLNRVMLHRPGKELENLVPGELERLLFDDIPYLKTAQQEHDQFADILRANGTEVVYLEDLAAQVIASDPDLKEHFIWQFIDEAGPTAQMYSDALYEYLNSFNDTKELVLKTMAGIYSNEIGQAISTPLVACMNKRPGFIADPIPNLYFTRDTFASIGTGVSLNRMFSQTRNRESLYGQFILEHHPDYAPGLKFYYKHNLPYSIEGGDILNLSSSVLAVGISQRTSPEAIELLAKNIFADEESTIDTILALDIPSIRAFMHLDTVCTMIDYDKFVVHPGILGSLRIFKITPGDGAQAIKVEELHDDIQTVLAEALGVDRITMIKCGGHNHVASEREQWNDGSNTLCIEPGKIIVYDRNYVTNEILRENGITTLEMKSSELSRGRGGPRCMSMPLLRRDL